ncbi:NAD(P)/FAD-dependent oxidoreductase [Pokkaliibacter sp. CJK22405]|uniref:NAD(P)/FAD-dependent oxidoreductase n=1 Tax=Pokkaliibacter sp. CJK22405 TaxID=3384615 RepID=UPI003984C6BB
MTTDTPLDNATLPVTLPHDANLPHIVIVGGGAGGLELATHLGKKLGRKKKANITLVDRSQSHIWKPLLHEVATGALDSGIDEVSYRGHAAKHHFHFQLGAMTALSREERHLTLAPVLDSDGDTVVPARKLHYDYLVMALGSQSNDFGTPGVSRHCSFLDSREQAERFRQRLLNHFLRLSVQQASEDQLQDLNIAIVGAGATGVELAAELRNAAGSVESFGFQGIDPGHINITLVEAGPRILPALSERISQSAHKELTKLGVDVRTATMITEASKEGLMTKEDGLIKADIAVWAAGIKAPVFLKELDGLETNKLNQLVTESTLHTTRDHRIYAIGDCAGCPMGENKWVPPRAQAAHQMASLVAENLIRQLEGKELKAFHYKDHGSLVSLSRFKTVGNLMGNLTSGSFFIEGHLARFAYISLYRMHQMALHGLPSTVLKAIVDRIHKVIRPRLKLH